MSTISPKEPRERTGPELGSGRTEPASFDTIPDASFDIVVIDDADGGEHRWREALDFLIRIGLPDA